MNDLPAEFKKHQRNSYLGNPEGEDSYGYGRASSEKQVEEGSSFPRQIENIHKTALRDGLRVAFEMLFFDDGYSGFEFEHRPALNRLREEVAKKPRAKHVIFEDIDRLSRDADWQQGFLLAEFARCQIYPHFHIHLGSQLERYVRGYIAQEGMRKDLERMRQGNLLKAKAGKVTARRRKFGYIKTHPQDSHYELHPEESKVMRSVYEKIIYDRWTLLQVARWLNDNHIPTHSKNGFWTPGTLYQMVRSTVYKGEFNANMNYHVKTGKFNDQGRPKRTNKKRPPEEWIKVEVPAIVTPDEWEQAMENLKSNNKLSLRNGKRRNWLIQGICKCETCKAYAMLTAIGGGKKNPVRYYGCNSRYSEKARGLGTSCNTPYVRADDLERKVWEKVEEVIYNPSIIIQRLEEKQREAQTLGLQGQIEYIEKQIKDLEKEKTKFEMAYQRDIYTLDEFEEKMKDLKGRFQALENSRSKLESKLQETHSIEEQKSVVLGALQRVRREVEKARQEQRLPNELPFELKRKILTLLVETVWVDTVKRTFTIEGEISGTYAIDDLENPDKDNGDFTLVSTPKWRQCATCPSR